MGQIQTFDEFVNLLRRRRGLMLVIIVAGMLLSAVYAKTRPDVYLAAAVIQVEIPTIVGTTESAPFRTSNTPQLLQAIEQRLTTRANLAALIERYGAFADLPGLARDKKIDLLRGAVTFESVGSLTGENYIQPNGVAVPVTNGFSAIIISARLGDPDVAARVANDLAQNVLDQSSSGQLARAEQNASFFRQEEARLWAGIAAVEAEISRYKSENSDALPTLRDAQRDELFSLNSALRTLAQERLRLKSELSQMSAVEQARETGRRAFEDLTAQISVADAQLASMTARRAEIEAALNLTPEVERVLAGFERRLAQLQQEYEAVNRRMAEAETAQRLAERQQSERFSLLERATRAEFPLGGGGRTIAIAGTLGSAVLALVVAFLLDLRRPVVRTAAQMERQLGLWPVISIPEISIPEIAPPKRPAPGGLRGAPILGLPRYAVLLLSAMLVFAMAAAVVI